MIFGETKVMILKDYPFIDMITKNGSNLKNTEGTVVGITSEGCYVVFPDNASVDCIYCERNEIMTLRECYRKMNKLLKSGNEIAEQLPADKLKVAANKIWDICKESPEMGNAVMDLIGDEAYQKVMKLSS